jgi:Cu/Ag efflux protein CusF
MTIAHVRLTVALAITVCCGAILLGCSSAPSKPSTTPTPVQTVTPTPDGDYPGTGKITKINRELGSVEIDHEAIKDVMPAMVMEFYVTDRKLLDGLTVGEQVDFTLSVRSGSENISAIREHK